MNLKSIEKYLFNLHWIGRNFLSEGNFALKYLEQMREKVIANSLAKNTEGRLIPVRTVDAKDYVDFGKQEIIRGIKNKTPLVVKGGANTWQCCSNWTPEKFIKRFEDIEISLIDASPKNLNEINYSTEHIKFSQMLEDLDADHPKYYSRFNSLLHKRPGLIQEVDKSWLESIKGKKSREGTFQLFIGGRNTRTHLHSAI